MKFLNKIKELSLKLAVFATIAVPTLSMAADSDKGIIVVNERLINAADSFGGLISIAAFIVGAGALFRAITTIMNHSENPRENPMKNVVFYMIAAGVGLGYGYFSVTALETVTGESSNDNIANDIFKANGTK